MHHALPTRNTRLKPIKKKLRTNPSWELIQRQHPARTVNKTDSARPHLNTIGIHLSKHCKRQATVGWPINNNIFYECSGRDSHTRISVGQHTQECLLPETNKECCAQETNKLCSRAERCKIEQQKSVPLVVKWPWRWSRLEVLQALHFSQLLSFSSWHSYVTLFTIICIRSQRLHRICFYGLNYRKFFYSTLNSFWRKTKLF